MLSKKIVLTFMAVSLLAFVAVGQVYARSNVAVSGAAAFLDSGDQGGIIFPWNINDGTSAASVSDWLNNPFQVAPTWQITLPGVFGLNTIGIDISSHGDTGSNPDDFVVEFGLNGKFSPVVSMRDYNQFSLWFGPPSPPAYSWAGFIRGGNQDTVQILLTDTIRLTEFNAADVDAGQSGRPHQMVFLDDIQAYDEGWPYDNVPVYTRPLSPTGVTLSADGKTLAWGGVVGASGYNVWISRADAGSLSPDYFCVNQLPGLSYLNDGMLTGTSYTLPLAWQGFAADLYTVTSVDLTGTNSFYSDPATEEQAPSCPDADGDGVIDSVETAGGWDAADSADNPMADLEAALDDLEACQAELATTQSALAAAQACIDGTNLLLGTIGCPKDSLVLFYLPPGIDRAQSSLSNNPNAVKVMGVKVQ